MVESEQDSHGSGDDVNGDLWPLPRVLDVVTVVLLVVVVVRAVGGVVTALGIPSPSIQNLPADSGVVGHLALFSVPTYERLQFGTQWADISTGLLLLAGVALLVLPRWIWDIGPGDLGLSVGSALVVVSGVLAMLTAAAGLIGMINYLLNVPGELNFTEAMSVADSVASVAVAALAAVLSWFGFRVVTESAGH